MGKEGHNKRGLTLWHLPMHAQPAYQCGKHDLTLWHLPMHAQPAYQCGKHDLTLWHLPTHAQPAYQCGKHDLTGRGVQTTCGFIKEEGRGVRH
jgi:hypothetical protein